MTSTNPKTITLKGVPLVKQGLSTDSILPGDLVALVSAGKVKKNTLNALNVRRAFALENAEIGLGIDQVYASGTTVTYGSFHQGQVVYCRVSASAPSIVYGDRLTAKSGGGVVKTTTASDVIVGYALESVNNSSNANRVLIKMEVA